MSGTAYDRVIDALESDGRTVKRNGGRRARAKCPAHDDNHPSLSVTGTEDGVLIYCHAECSSDDVTAALGLTMADLYDDSRHGRFKGRDYLTSYPYDNGRTGYRTADKQFPQSGTDKPPELYRVENLRQAVRQGKRIYIVEAERTSTPSKPSTRSPLRHRWAPGNGRGSTRHR